MAQKHDYPNHAHVISVLTNLYGFKYTGLGDNYEECFSRGYNTPETIFIHRMHCSYYKAVSPQISAERINIFERRTSYHSESEQLSAFNRLLAHLDDLYGTPPKSAVVAPPFAESMKFINNLWPLFREKYTSGELSLNTALSALGLTMADYEKMIKDKSD